MMLVADIGGTNMRIASGEADGSIREIRNHPTPPSFEEGMALLISEMQALKGDESVECIVIGVPGSVSEDGHTLISAKHLPDWSGHDIAAALEVLDAPVTLENDTTLGALGEALGGAGKGFPIVAYLAVGTGIGGARVVDGAIDQNSYGFEIGHQYLSSEDETELEELVSGTAVEAAEGIPAKELVSEEKWRGYANKFAHGLYNTLLHWSPDVVVLGGSLMRNNGMRVEDIVAELERINEAIPTLPEVRKAELEYPGLVGALLLGST
jgi:predicted NBD/HSP70 family sugar kinase